MVVQNHSPVLVMLTRLVDNYKAFALEKYTVWHLSMGFAAAAARRFCILAQTDRTVGIPLHGESSIPRSFDSLCQSRRWCEDICLSNSICINVDACILLLRGQNCSSTSVPDGSN